jgi:hypothetical protein
MAARGLHRGPILHPTVQECMMRDNANTELAWPAVAFLFVITLFGVVLVGHMPKWPIYVTILVWWGFVIYTFIHINQQKDASTSGD